MMTALLEFRQLVKTIYSKYDIYIKAAVRFVLAFGSFLLLNEKLGFMQQLKNPLISLALAIVCTFLPVNMIVLLAGVLVLAHAYALSIEVCAVVGGILAVMYFLYFRISPKLGSLLVLTPLCFALNIPCAVSLVGGLLCGPAAAVPVGCGTVAYYLLQYMSGNSTSLGVEGAENKVTKAVSLLESLVGNKEMYLVILAMVLTVLVVYVIRRMSVDHSWELAILLGLVVYIVIRLLGAFLPDAKVGILPLLLGSIGSAAIAFVVKFFVFSVDYTRTERVQFEDDEYYYYVKAVPKNSIAVPEKKVKKIMPQRKQGKVVKRIDS